MCFSATLATGATLVSASFLRDANDTIWELGDGRRDKEDHDALGGILRLKQPTVTTDLSDHTTSPIESTIASKEMK